ncbi:VQ motif-containing protein 4-like [Musa acuminata AAA Group]|uniref:VQ motif-containing protein 4-like n=1 Tax=Musa acuminata AAA Group TaxID=214697 RepID=UPI0031E3C786
MESHPKARETFGSSSSNYSCTNGTTTAAAPPSSSPPAPPPLTPKSVARDGEVNPYQTTFVQADTSSFKQVVQMLTGSAETVAATATAAAAAAATNSTARKAPVAPAAKATGPKKPAFKLYERRNSLKNLKILSPLIPTFFNSNPNSPVTAAGFSPRKQPEILSPSILDFPSLVLSPVTPLIPDPFNRPPHPNSEAAKWAEDRAIAEKGFYLHPSPRASAEAEPPRLLPLFPVTSPEVSSDLSLAIPRSSTREV